MFFNSNTSFYHNRFSTESVKAMGRFRNHIILSYNTWFTRYYLPKNDRYSSPSTQWTLVCSKNETKIFSMEIIDDEVDTAVADVHLDILTITHCVFKWIIQILL